MQQMMHNAPSWSEDLDPLFLLPNGHQLRLPEPCRTARMVDWHTHRVARIPKDLTAHVRRIYLVQQLRDSDALANALADLFIVLGPHGQALKQRLVRTLGPDLPAHAAAFLANHVEGSLTASDPLPWSGTSTLGQGLSGSPVVIRRQDQPR